MMKKLILLLVLSLDLISANVVEASAVFPLSTELQIGKIRNLLDRAPKGIYLSVGGERAFRGASLFKGIEHLIIFDISPEIIRFNEINIELLRASNKEEYKKLRWEGSFVEWQKISQKVTQDDFTWWDDNIRNIKHYSLPEELNRYGSALYHKKYLIIYKKLMSLYPQISNKFNNYDKVFLRNVEWADIQKHVSRNSDSLTTKEFQWWDEERKKKASCINTLISNPSQAVDLSQMIDYRMGNYLFDEELYQRLHNLVLQNKITMVQTDMAASAGLDSVIQIIKRLNIKLGVMDLDNLFIYQYMGEEKLRAIISKLLDLGSDDSILILMNNYKMYACTQFSIYLGFTFENIRHWPKSPFFNAFIDSLSAEVSPLIDGRLYEGNDMLPLYMTK